MAYSAPSDPVGGTVITVAAYVTNSLDNIRWLRLLTGNADPPGAGYAVGSDSTTATSWKTIAQILGYTPANKAGDTFTGNVSIALTATPTQGYLILGNNSAYYVGFDGSKHLIVTPALHVQNDLYVYRTASPTTGYVILNNAGTIYVGNDGTNVVTNTGKVWTEGNDGPASGLAAQTAATATSAADAAALGGVAPSGYARFAKGIYSGSASADRTITTGFPCKWVHIYGTNVPGTVMIFVDITSTTIGQNVAIATRTSGSPAANPILMADATRLDGTDGFHVSGTGTDSTDVTGFSYFWTAIG